MVAYAEDLSAYYDVEYVQGKGCQKASSNVQRIIKNNNQVFHIWNGLRTADFLNGKNPLCGMIPTEQNFVNSVLKYPLFFTGTDGIDKKDIFKDDNGFNEKTIIGFMSFAVMTLYSITDLITGYMGMDLPINDFVYNSFLYITLGCFGIAGVEKVMGNKDAK